MTKRKIKRKRYLKRHQCEAKHFVMEHNGRAGLFMDVGTGKTLTGIRCVKDDAPALIICRRDDVLTWQFELEAEGVPLEEVYASNLPPDTDTDNLESAWIIVTYDRVKREPWRSWVMETPFQWVIADESHYLRGPKSERTKQVIKVTRHIPHRLALTATPIGNNLMDVFPQALFIDDGQTFGTSWWKFRNKYFIQSGPGWYRRRKAKQEVADKMKRFAFSVNQDDVLDLPPKRYIVKGCPMSGQQRRVYERLIKDWEYEITREIDNQKKKEVIELDYVTVMMQKLKQVASGFFYDDKKQVHHLRSHKYNLLTRTIKEDLPDVPKIVVWGSFRAELERIATTLDEAGISHVNFWGGKKKDEARQRFTQDPGIRVFLGQNDSGVGMNELIGAPAALYFSNSYKSISRTQSEGRTRRIGSEHHKCILYVDLLTEGTIDVPIHHDVQQHIATAQWIVSQLRKGVSLRNLIQ